MSINKVVLVGNVGKDPVVRYFEKGVAKATFPLATSESYTNQQGETVTSTEWHNVVLWRSLAEVAEKTVKKGSQVYIVGKIKTRSYVDRDGVNKYITEILADTMFVFDKKQQVPGASNLKPAEPSQGKVNEPAPGYGKMPDYDDSDNFQKGAASSQTEDDLPF